MSANLEPLLFEGEHLVRAISDEAHDIGFVGVDVCRVLGIAKHHQTLNRLDPDERGTCIVGTPGGDQEMIVVWEPGLYRLMFTSRKPVAERFKRWLAHEVIPSLRRTGHYGRAVPEPELLPPPHAEQRPFPDWTLEELRTKGQTIDRYRITLGLPAAQWIMPQLGFPVPPPEILQRGRQISIFDHLNGGESFDDAA